MSLEQSPHDRVTAHFARLGYRESRARICPRVVAGLRCHGWSSRHGRCLCDVHQLVLDHRRIWMTDRGHVLTAEPYGIQPQALVALAADLDPLGLAVTVGGDSPWCPGATTLITIARRLSLVRRREAAAVLTSDATSDPRRTA